MQQCIIGLGGESHSQSTTTLRKTRFSFRKQGVEGLLASLSMEEKSGLKEPRISKDTVKAQAVPSDLVLGRGYSGTEHTLKAQRAHVRRTRRIALKRDVHGDSRRKLTFMKNYQWGIPVSCQQLMQVRVSLRLRLRFDYELFLLLFK